MFENNFRIKDSLLIGGAIERKFWATFCPDPEKNRIEVSVISEKLVGVDVVRTFESPPVVGNIPRNDYETQSNSQRGLPTPQTPATKNKLSAPSKQPAR